MPNWCEGNIRFRGKKKDIKNFLMNEIIICDYVNDDLVEYKPIIEDLGYELYILKNSIRPFYIKNTHRNFIETDCIQIFFEEEDDEKETVVCIDHYRTAWSFTNNKERWKDIVQKYHFDVKMVGFEKGMCFSQTVTLHRNGEVEEQYRKFDGDDDWMWNADFPNYGG